MVTQKERIALRSMAKADRPRERVLQVAAIELLEALEQAEAERYVLALELYANNICPVQSVFEKELHYVPPKSCALPRGVNKTPAQECRADFEESCDCWLAWAKQRVGMGTV